MTERIAPDYGVSPRLALAVIRAESNFNPMARSPKNAQGLMQLIPETSIRFNVKNPYDPVQNVRGGLSYLRWLLAYFEGDVALVAAAYNSGEQTVNRYRGVPPYAETRAANRYTKSSGGTIIRTTPESPNRPPSCRASAPRTRVDGNIMHQL